MVWFVYPKNVETEAKYKTPSRSWDKNVAEEIRGSISESR